MNYRIDFTKVSGAGNDFVLIDDRLSKLPVGLSRLATTVCSRPFGVGADGLLILRASSKADFGMLYYNADGSHGGMCGNGGRCIARYAYLKGISPSKLTFDALDFIYKAEVRGESVRLLMKNPNEYKEILQIDSPLGRFGASFINTGSPHVILFENSIANVDVGGIGRVIRNHELFRPEGTNVNFVQIKGRNSIALRTYERGVEGETLACGTGAVAAAVVSALKNFVPSQVQVLVKSGETLTVGFNAQTLTEVYLEGSAHMVFDGTISYDDNELSSEAETRSNR